MAKWDLKTDHGLRAACAEAQERLDPAHLARVTKFLQEVAAVPPDKRAEETFQQAMWQDNPIAKTLNFAGHAVKDSGFRHWFAERTQADLPKDPAGRPDALWEIFWDTVNREELIWTNPEKADNKARPRRQTLRTLIALFPADLAGPIASESLIQLRQAMGGPVYKDGPLTEVYHACREQLMNSRWLRTRLEQVLGESQDMEGHARRLLVSQLLAEETPRVWLVRAGKHGEDELAALDRGLAILGFPEVEALSGAADGDAVGERVRRAFPEASNPKVKNHTIQLWQFAGEMRQGDLVVMPRKQHPDDLAAVVGTRARGRPRGGKRLAQPHHLRAGCARLRRFERSGSLAARPRHRKARAALRSSLSGFARLRRLPARGRDAAVAASRLLHWRPRGRGRLDAHHPRREPLSDVLSVTATTRPTRRELTRTAAVSGRGRLLSSRRQEAKAPLRKWRNWQTRWI